MKSLDGISFKTRRGNSILDGGNVYRLSQQTLRADFARCSQSGRGGTVTKHISHVGLVLQLHKTNLTL